MKLRFTEALFPWVNALMWDSSILAVAKGMVASCHPTRRYFFWSRETLPCESPVCTCAHNFHCLFLIFAFSLRLIKTQTEVLLKNMDYLLYLSNCIMNFIFWIYKLDEHFCQLFCFSSLWFSVVQFLVFRQLYEKNVLHFPEKLKH